MRGFKLGLIAGACALALSACGGGDDSKESKEKAAANPAAPASPMNPSPKAGLWEETVSIEGASNQVMRKCVGENASNVLTSMGAQDQKTCPDRAVKQNGSAWTMEMTCNLGSGGTLKSTATVTGDFTTNYTAKATNTVSGAEAPQMNRTTNVNMSAKWIGACPEGMGPGAVDYGDIVIDPSGMKK